MGFFTKFKLRRNLKRAKIAAQASPSPKCAKAMINAYAEDNQVDNALYIARQAVDMYPRSESMRAAFQRLNNAKYSSEVKVLQTELGVRPNPITYTRLADRLFEVREIEKSLQVSVDGTVKFPDYEGNYLIAGKIRYQRFKEDFLARDGLAAVDYFEKALELNGANYKTLLQLAEIYLEIGAVNEGIDKLEILQASHSEDERTRQLMEYARSLPGTPEADLKYLFKSIEENSNSLAATQIPDNPDGWTLRRFSGDFHEMKEKIKCFRTMEGFLGASIFDNSGNLIATFLNWEVDEELFNESLKGAFLAAWDSSMRLDIGRIQSTYMETSAFNLHIFTFGHLAFVMMVMVGTKQTTVEAAINDFIDRELYAHR